MTSSKRTGEHRRTAAALPAAMHDNEDIISGIDPSCSVEKDESICWQCDPTCRGHFWSLPALASGKVATTKVALRANPFGKSIRRSSIEEADFGGRLSAAGLTDEQLR